MIEIFDNFLDDDSFSNLNKVINGNWWFDWHYVSHAINPYLSNNPIFLKLPKTKFMDYPVLRHNFYDSRPAHYQRPDQYFEHIDNLSRQIAKKINKEVELLSCYANLIMPSNIKNEKNPVTVPHVDYENNGKQKYTAIFYITESKSGTVLYNEMCKIGETLTNMDVTENCVVDSVPNRLLIFNSYIFHSAPIYSKTTRIILNFNFQVNNH